MFNLVILFSTVASALRSVLPTVTVEAEYGDELVEGSVLTLAHHGERSSFPCPSLAWGGWKPIGADGPITYTCKGVHGDWEGPLESLGAEIKIGVSHFDLDTLLGVYPLLKNGVAPPAFCRLAAYVDTNGPHRAADCPEWADEEVRDQYHAFCAWSTANRLPRFDGEGPHDVTTFFKEAADILAAIFNNDEALIAKGKSWAEEQAYVADMSWEGHFDTVAIREYEGFVNHLYRGPHNKVYKAIVARDTRSGSITVSFESPIKGKSCKEFVQSLWGPEAGGHDGIAGSPRGVKMTDDLFETARKLQLYLNE